MISPAKLKAREEKAAEMYRMWAVEGRTQAEIGSVFGCSKQYVGQLIKPLLKEDITH